MVYLARPSPFSSNFTVLLAMSTEKEIETYVTRDELKIHYKRVKEGFFSSAFRCIFFFLGEINDVWAASTHNCKLHILSEKLHFFTAANSLSLQHAWSKKDETTSEPYTTFFLLCSRQKKFKRCRFLLLLIQLE
jgi:hypothetical protein